MLEAVERDFLLAYRVGGIRTALGTLNARTRFRMTALVSMEPGESAARNVYDRENPRINLDHTADDLSLIAQAIAHDCAAIQRADETSAKRPREMAEAVVVPSRVGALVLTDQGSCWGVLFHFDRRLRLAASSERAILAHLGGRLARLCPDAIRGRAMTASRR
jgi:hypothetical protein